MSKPLSEKLYVAPSRIHGMGGFAKRIIRAGKRIGKFEGRRVSEDSAHVLWCEEPDGDWVGLLGDNDLRFVNHSLEPNAEYRGPEMYALRDIEKTEEITVHYGDEWTEHP